MLPDRMEKLLSGEEIINSKNSSLKDLPSGCKEYAPNNSWLEGKQIQTTLDAYHSLISSERVEKKSNLSTAVWLRSVGKAKVTKKSGKHWEVFGHSVNSEDWLLPEEALFLLETSALELHLDDVPLSVEQTYALIIGEHCTLQDYRVYSYLSRKGFRVLRHDKEITVTSYEKDIRLDQVSLASKRIIPGAKKAVGSGAGSVVEKPLDSEVSIVDGCLIEDDVSQHVEDGEVHARAGTPPSTGGFEEITVSSRDTAPPAAEDVKVGEALDPVYSSGKSGKKSTKERTDKDCPRSVPPTKKVDSSPDLMIIENEDNDVIEIDTDDPEESDVEITDVSSRMLDTVDLMDSDEDDDVVFVCQKSSNNDPSKWRKWFMTVKDFVNTDLPEPNPQEAKSSKIKLIDLFDLANKSVDSIMRAIPQHNGRDEFINAPDQRFIPSTVLPRYSHYRINLNVETRSVSRTSTAYDSSHTLQDVIRFGSGPDNYSREGYSFHRTRTFGGFNRFFGNGSQGQTFNRHFMRGSFFNHRGNYDGSNNFGGSYHRNSNTFHGRNANYNPNFGMNQNQGHDFQNPPQSTPAQAPGNNFGMNQGQGNNFQNSTQSSSFRNSGGHQNQFGGFQNNQFGNFQNQNNIGSQMKLAMTQAVQMHMLAMSVLQSSQAMMQHCGLPGMLGNLGMGNNFPLGNMNPFMNVGSFNPMNNFRGRRPFRRRYQNFRNPPPVAPRVTEVTDQVVCIDLANDDAKVKHALKRTVALDAIANMNTRKKTKVMANIVIDDAKSFKSESPGSTPKRESEPVKNESPRVKKNEPKPIDIISISSDMDVEEAVSARVADDRSETVSTPLSIAEVISSPSVVLEDSMESVAVEIVEMPAEPVDQNLPSPPEEPNTETEHLVETTVTERPVETSSTEQLVETTNMEQSVEAADENGQCEESVSNNYEEPVGEASNEAGEGVDEAGSWQMYKAGGSQLPIPEKSFQSLLTYDDERASVKDVLQSLQITGPIDETESLRDVVRVTYDVYLPNRPFKKSLKLVPNYRVIVSSTACFPSVFELNYLRQTYKDDVPFLYAVVYEDSVAFYQLRAISLPTLTPRPAHS